MEYSRVGADSHITPREIIRDFIELLDILYQHPEKTAGELLNGQVLGDMSAGTSQFMKPDAHTAGRSAGDSSFAGPEKAGRDDEDELTTFTL